VLDWIKIKSETLLIGRKSIGEKELERIAEKKVSLYKRYNRGYFNFP
jgi:hypothetical protein